MKMIMIAMILLMIQVSAGILNAIDFTNSYSIQPDQESLDSIENNIESQDYLQNVAAEDTSVSFGFGDFFRGIYIFVQAVVWSVVNVKGTIETMLCGLAQCDTSVALIATYIAVIVYFIWGIALAQFISNRSAKGME